MPTEEGFEQQAIFDQLIVDYAQLPTDVPLLLLPIRLETRYDMSAALATLQVRIYPDDIHANDHDPRLSENEMAMGERYWEEVAAAAGDEDRLNQAWLAMTSRLRPWRAIWVIKATDPASPTAELRTGQEQASYAQLLPDYWIVAIYSEGVLTRLVTSTKVSEDLALIPMPDEVAEQAGDPLPISEASKWLVDFDKALEVGMAVEIPQMRDTFIEELFVCGVRTSLDQGETLTQLGDLLDSHHYTKGIDFVPFDTPTNNTENVASGWSPTDVDLNALYDREFGAAPALTDDAHGRLAAAALGLPVDGRLARLEHSAIDHASATLAMMRMLWPVAPGHYLETLLAGEEQHLLSSADISWIKSWYLDQVRADGHLPVLRIGRQPYSLLPVAAGPAGEDPESKTLEDAVISLKQGWDNSLSAVARMHADPSQTDGDEDPGADLITILSSLPYLWTYYLRNLEFLKWTALPGLISGGSAPDGIVPIYNDLVDRLEQNHVTPLVENAIFMNLDSPALGRPKQPIGLAHFLDLRVRAQNPAILGIPM